MVGVTFPGLLLARRMLRPYANSYGRYIFRHATSTAAWIPGPLVPWRDASCILHTRRLNQWLDRAVRED